MLPQGIYGDPHQELRADLTDCFSFTPSHETVIRMCCFS
jgi:hypothetical protein